MVVVREGRAIRSYARADKRQSKVGREELVFGALSYVAETRKFQDAPRAEGFSGS